MKEVDERRKHLRRATAVVVTYFSPSVLASSGRPRVWVALYTAPEDGPAPRPGDASLKVAERTAGIRVTWFNGQAR